MKARITYNSKLELRIPKEDNAPMLFMEWMAYSYPNSRQYCVKNDMDNNELVISGFGIREDFEQAKAYINANM